MIFRQAKSTEVRQLFMEGYHVWSKGRTFEQYCADNAKEDEYGTRYVLEKDGQIVSSAIILYLKRLGGHKVYGIGSVLTPKKHQGKGYATALLKNCMAKIRGVDNIVLLHSDVEPGFYERFGFLVLPNRFQQYPGSTYMACCTGKIWEELLQTPESALPKHF